MSWTSLCEVEELLEGEGKYVEIGGFQLAVFRDANRFFVVDNTCPHAGGSLSGGQVEDGCVICPWHAWAFHLENGQLRGLPGVTISTYKTRVYPIAGKPSLLQADLPIF
jgi:nitrite reductase (NADH) small subunit/3-phenylpropionate/trans-cinnamate dioxygenase ferredoxin subunit